MWAGKINNGFGNDVNNCYPCWLTWKMISANLKYINKGLKVPSSHLHRHSNKNDSHANGSSEH